MRGFENHRCQYSYSADVTTGPSGDYVEVPVRARVVCGGGPGPVARGPACDGRFVAMTMGLTCIGIYQMALDGSNHPPSSCTGVKP